ncbi:amino acid adenylation domain-containing protein [Pseudomonas gingeri]|nr:amino acid adenylation domain-containing protein [Pseudomonas gingeri]
MAQRIDPSNPRYNCAGYLEIVGAIDTDLLQQAIVLALQETEALRVRFVEEQGEPWQIIDPHSPQPLTVVDLSEQPDAQQTALSWMKRDLGTAQDLVHSQLHLHALFKLGPEHSFFYLRYHHILMDGYGQTLYWRRIGEIYSALSAQQQYPLSSAHPLSVILADEAEYEASARHEDDRQAWLDKLLQPPAALQLSDNVALSNRGMRRLSAPLPKPLEIALQARAKSTGTGWSVLIITAIAIYIRKLSSSNDLLLTLPVSARLNAAARSTPTMLANELPLRLNVSAHSSFKELVHDITRNIGFALAHQRYRGEALHRDQQRSGARSRLSGPVINVISFDQDVRFGDCPTIPHYLSTGPVEDLLIGCYGRADGSGLQLFFDANPGRYSQADLKAHQDRFLQVLSALLNAEPDQPIHGVDGLLPVEHSLLAKWNATERPYDLNRSLDQLWDEQAQRTPDRIAVTGPSGTLTYGELQSEVNRLSAHLVTLGVRPGQRVGVCDVRSLEMVIALLAVLKVGAAYVPLDPELPSERLDFQVEDAQLVMVLTRSTLSNTLAALQSSGCRTLCVDRTLPDLPHPGAPLEHIANPQNAAYVIYTSGSTGQPKGVEVPHRGVVNRILWMQEQYSLQADDCVLQKTPFTFDVSVWEFFWPLLFGCQLVLAEPGAHKDPRRIAQLIRDYRVTTLHFVPSMLDLFLEEPELSGAIPLRRVFCSGEALRAGTVKAFFDTFPPSTAVALHNLYGPTEASIDVTHWTCSASDAQGSVPIGHPVANTRLHILDEAGQPVPIGTVGELYISGVQVALGYINRPEINAMRFLPDADGQGQVYRTGDLARYRRDGAIEFLGRMDDQVKIRGFRIEPGEIESVLMSHERVALAAVTAWQPPLGELRLVAYVVASASQTPSTKELVDHLSISLPEYMVAQHFVFLDALPLSRNGKLDRGALPAPMIEQTRAVLSLDTPEEHLLGAIWQNLLGIDSPDPELSFFALGGDSMLAIRARSLAEQQGYSFNVQDVFNYPTLRQLATHLRPFNREIPVIRAEPFDMLRPQDRSRLPAGLVDAYPLSAMQGGMIYHAELARDSSVYRVVTSLHIGTRFDETLLRNAIAATVQRHPVLRTRFDLSTFSEPLQLVQEHATAPVEVIETLLGQPSAAIDMHLATWVDQAKHHHFELSNAALMAFTVHLRAADAFQLSVIEHHVILDGWSDAAMLEEIIERYAAALEGQDLWLPQLPSSYRDFVAAEREALLDESSRDFWQQRLVGSEPTLLPRASDKTLGSNATRHKAFEVSVAPVLLDQLQQVARAQALPLKSLLAAAHLAVQRLVGNTEQVVTGMVVNARLEEDGGDAVLGVFLNTLPLCIDTREQSLLNLARLAFAFERDAAPHRRFPFTEIEQLADGLQLDSYVNFIDFHSLWKHRDANGALIRHGIGVAETNYPLAVNFLIDPVSGHLRAWLDCDLNTLDEAFCNRLTGYYGKALSALVEQGEQSVAELALMEPAEQARIDDWNRTDVDFNRAATVHGLFEEQVDRTPDAIALAHRDSEISYLALDAQANRLAHHLIAGGLKPGSLVGVSLYRGIDMVMAILAVLKAGCAYVPLDPEYPYQRLAFIAEDSGLAALIAQQSCQIIDLVKHNVLIDRDKATLSQRPSHRPRLDLDAEATAYVIYTSGSTGLPKGTVIRHRNVTNFFEGMDRRIGCTAQDTVLALTSMSFDISVLELLWPLVRGAKVVVAGERIIQNLAPDPQVAARPLGLSLFFFSAGAADDQRQEGYRLLIEGAKAADAMGLEAIWTPERHFHEFGGLYPNPSVMSAALAAVTQRIAIRCGSVVAPLHDTLRLAEEWSLVDNLSQGRVGLAFASGWNANDFALAPEAYGNRKQQMLEQIDEFKRLWRGEALERVNGNGERVALRIFPRPVQSEPPMWLTSAGAVETFERAGASGANLLTHLLGQDIDELARKISAYRSARNTAGHASPGRVTVMVHTYLDEDAELARSRARGPFREYLRTSTELWRMLFSSMGVEYPELMTEEDIESVLDMAVDRYFDRSGLFGSPESVSPTLRALAGAGADEVACLVDFGVATDDALQGIATLGRLKQLHDAQVADADHCFAQLCRRHAVTLVQGTPSLIAAVCAEPQALAALENTRALLVGGEAFPAGLADRLLAALPRTRVFNMYGPTETTIWSTVHELQRNGQSSLIPIGQPIANTEVLILNAQMQRQPIGVAGELWIAGEGVSGLYLGRPELTAERFPLHPQGGGQIYRTGDRARWRTDGTLELLGRIDRQVKILGHRIEPDEVESVLSRHPDVTAVAVVPVETATGYELIAYLAVQANPADTRAQDSHVLRWGDIWEGAYANPHSGVSHVPGSEFAGWASSYTGQPIALNEMQEWLHHTVARVRDLHPRSLIDVGVGVGLLLRNLAPVVEAYLGIDVSQTALTAARQSLSTVDHAHCRVELVQGDAGELSSIGTGTADTIVINSVVQYFPSSEYLERVVREAVRIVSPQGQVFIGDVRHLGLLEAFHASVQLAKAEPLTTAAELMSTIARNVKEEGELCLAPSHFIELANQLGTVAETRIELKRGHALNELTLFRYDVSLIAQPGQKSREPGTSRAWGSSEQPATLTALEQSLSRLGTAPLTITGIPNLRLVKPLALLRLLAEVPACTIAWELERQLWLVEDSNAIDPEDVANLAERLGLEVQLLIQEQDQMDRFDARFSLPRHRIQPAEQTDIHPAAVSLEQTS